MIQASPNARKFKNQTLRKWEVLHRIYVGSTATGDLALSTQELISRYYGEKRKRAASPTSSTEDLIEEDEVHDASKSTPKQKATPNQDPNSSGKVKRSRIDNGSKQNALSTLMTSIGTISTSMKKVLDSLEVGDKAVEDNILPYSIL